MASKLSISFVSAAIGLLLVLQSCSLTKTVPEGDYLLMKVKYDIDNKHPQKQKLPEYKEQVKYKPNRKILGLTRFHLRLYNAATSVKDSTKNTKKLRSFFRKVGEPPVLFDSAFTQRSAENLQRYLFNNGYYDAEVDYSVKFKKKKAKYIKYHIDIGYYYSINKFEIECEDSLQSKLLQNGLENSLIRKGRRLEFETINEERERVLNVLRSNGYYAFKKDYLNFELDTIKENQVVNLKLIVDYPKNKNADEIYNLNNVVVKINSPFFKKDSYFETISDVKFYTNKYPISPKLLNNKLAIKPGNIFSQSNIDISYRRYTELGVFDNVIINTILHDSSKHLLNAEIVLTPSKRQSFSIEPQLISSDLSNQISNLGNYRNYGVAGIASYSHKNIFKGAERLDLSYTLRAETQINAQDRLNRFFTNFQTGVTANLFFPSSYLWQNTAQRFDLNSVKSVISLSYIYENNLDFKRNIMPMSFSYQFHKGHDLWQFTPIEISYSNSLIVSGFLDRIATPDVRDFVKRLFDNNLITSTGFRWNHNHFKANNPKDYIIVRTNVIEFGGNIHRMIRRGLDTEKNADTTYNFLGVNYFQFAKSEIDLRLGKYLDYNNAIAGRINIGAGIPFGNDDILPFDKRFFIGGSNGLRGWRPRTLGPGSYVDTSVGTRIDKSGDIIIQGSFEYRFKFISPLELGLFIDAGNVWNMVENSGTSEAEMFRFKRFMNEFALNTGLGLRFDFDFFIFRIDFGMQLRNPAVKENNGWVAKNLLKFKGIEPQLGVGYPF